MRLIKKFVSNNFNALIGSRMGIGFQRQELITVFARIQPQRGKKTRLRWRLYLAGAVFIVVGDFGCRCCRLPATHSINKYCITACRNLRLCQMCVCVCICCMYVCILCVCVCVCLLCVRAELLIKYLRCLFAKWIILAFYFASTMCSPCLSCLRLSLPLSLFLCLCLSVTLFCVC